MPSSRHRREHLGGIKKWLAFPSVLGGARHQRTPLRRITSERPWWRICSMPSVDALGLRHAEPPPAGFERDTDRAPLGTAPGYTG